MSTPTDDASQSLAAGRPKRAAVVPVCTQTSHEHLMGLRAKRLDNEQSQKRKSFAEDRDATSGVEEPTSLKRPRISTDSALTHQYDRTLPEAECKQWLYTAILARNGEDLRSSGLEVEELEEAWFDPQANKEPGPDRYPGIAVGPVIGSLDGVEVGAMPSKDTPLKLGKLKATDSLTVGIGSPLVYHNLRGLDGKHNKIEGYNDSGASPDQRVSNGTSPDHNVSKNVEQPVSRCRRYMNMHDARVTPVPLPKPRTINGALHTHAPSPGTSVPDTPAPGPSAPSSSTPGPSAPGPSAPSPSAPSPGHPGVPPPQPALSRQLPTPPSSQGVIGLSNGSTTSAPSAPPATPAAPATHLATPTACPTASASMAHHAAPVTCPATRPATRPSTRPATHPATHPVTPAVRLATTMARRMTSAPAHHPAPPTRSIAPIPVLHQTAPQSRQVGSFPLSHSTPGPADVQESESPGDMPDQSVDDAKDDDEGKTTTTAKRLTKKQMAQLNRFGTARPLVKMLTERIKIRAITECAYADVLPPDTVVPKPKPREKPSNPSAPENDPVPTLPRVIDVEVLSDQWVVEEWAVVNKLLRPQATPLTLKQEYCQYVREDFSGIRNHVKTTLTALVFQVYGFTRGFSEENIKLCEKLLDDAFHSPTLVQPDNRHRFHHEILIDAIRLCWYSSRKAVGFKFNELFERMPIRVIALVCTIIHFLISEFSTGEHVRGSLDASLQCVIWQGYLDHLVDMGKPKNNQNRLIKLCNKMFQQCGGNIVRARRERVQAPVHIYETDSELEEDEIENIVGQGGIGYGEENGDEGMEEGYSGETLKEAMNE